MIDIEKEKRIKLFDKVYLWIGKNKITIGDTESNEHFTMLVNNEGILDAHKTIQGSEKQYEPLLKLDLKELSQKLENNPDIIKNFETEIFDNVKEVNFTEPEFEECKIVLVKNNEEISKLATKVKRNVVLGENTINESEFIPWFEASGKVKEKALVLDKNDSSIGYLFNRGDTVFFMEGDFMMNSYFANIIMNMATMYGKESNS